MGRFLFYKKGESLNKTCYLCGSANNITVFYEHDIPILECIDCGHVFSSYIQADHYDGYWGEEEENFDLEWWDNAHRKIYQTFIQKFLKQEEGSLLDVGCGLGFFVKMVMEKKPHWNVIGYEMSRTAVKFAREKNRLPNVFQGMVEKSNLSKNSLDVITMWDVIEHIPKPKPLLEYLHSLLKPNGFLFIQTPNFPIQLIKAKLKVALLGMKPNGHYLEAKDHINNYKLKTIKDLSLMCKFQEPQFFILPPILSVSGSKNIIGKLGKLGYYYTTKLIWDLSFKTIFLNNTIFAVLKKK